MQPTGTPPCDPSFFRFPLKVQLGIGSIPYSTVIGGFDVIRMLQYHYFPGHNASVFTIAFLLFAVCKLL